MSKRTIDEAYLREIVGAFNRRDVDAIGNYFAPQGRFYTARGKTERGMELVGPAAISRYLADRFMVAGPPDACVEKFLGLMDAGATNFILPQVLPGPIETTREIAKEFIPKLRAAAAAR